MSAQFIFTMHKVGRFVAPDKDVLKDITLAFYPGAKIGVLGPNGAASPPCCASWPVSTPNTAGRPA